MLPLPLPLLRRLFENFLLVLVAGMRRSPVLLLLFRADLFWFRLLFLVPVLLFLVLYLLILLLLARFLLFYLLIPVLLLKLVLLQ